MGPTNAAKAGAHKSLIGPTTVSARRDARQRRHWETRRVLLCSVRRLVVAGFRHIFLFQAPVTGIEVLLFWALLPRLLWGGEPAHACGAKGA